MTLQDILNDYKPITLEEMNDIRLMNRIDTKFVTTIPVLKQLLEIARDDYYVQETGGLRISPYYTLYFDTEDCKMYNRHEAGHLTRQKVRVRMAAPESAGTATCTSVQPPTGGSAHPKVLTMTSVAFCPVVTSVRQTGIRASRAGRSVAWTTSRNLSEALSLRRRIAQAVS